MKTKEGKRGEMSPPSPVPPYFPLLPLLQVRAAPNYVQNAWKSAIWGQLKKFHCLKRQPILSEASKTEWREPFEFLNLPRTHNTLRAFRERLNRDDWLMYPSVSLAGTQNRLPPIIKRNDTVMLLCIGHELSTARHHILGEHFRQPISKRFIQAKLFTHRHY